jgi:hypothetical protein
MNQHMQPTILLAGECLANLAATDGEVDQLSRALVESPAKEAA